MTQPLLSIRGLRKTYDTPQGALMVLDGVDLDLGSGETVALMGESGSGKSTLLHLAAGLDTPDDGEIFIGGHDVAAMGDSARAQIRRSEIGLVFQQFNLISSLDVRANLAFQARLAGRLDRDWMSTLTQRLGLAALLDRFPEQLSGGQQQRVAIGRALAARPRVMLADEPTGNLDETTADEVMALTLELVRDVRCGLLMVTHSERLASKLSRRAVLRAGRLS